MRGSVEEKMREFGWDFYPTGAEEWTWVKFDTNGVMVATEGDKEWKQDLRKAKK